MTVWFTSDTHYGHSKVIDYSNRPFKDVDEMNEMMVQNWNAVVRPGDLVYHLGDFSFQPEERAIQTAKRLMGQKYLIFGNHDKRHRKVPEFCSQWIWTKDLHGIEVGDTRIVLCHYAMLTWNQSHRGAWQLHGHSHGSLPEDPKTLRQDVGVDVWNYQPVSFEELQRVMARREYEPIDHHGLRDREREDGI